MILPTLRSVIVALIASASVDSAEAAPCKGKTDVTSTCVSGQFICPEVTSLVTGSVGLGEVGMTIRFTATP